MATLSITNTRPVRRNVLIAPSLDNVQPARSMSPPIAMNRPPDPRSHTSRATYQPGDCDNWRPRVELVKLKIVTTGALNVRPLWAELTLIFSRVVTTGRPNVELAKMKVTTQALDKDEIFLEK